jgi:hypothetical protein
MKAENERDDSRRMIYDRLAELRGKETAKVDGLKKRADEAAVRLVAAQEEFRTAHAAYNVRKPRFDLPDNGRSD